MNRYSIKVSKNKGIGIYLEFYNGVSISLPFIVINIFKRSKLLFD